MSGQADASSAMSSSSNVNVDSPSRERTRRLVKLRRGLVSCIVASEFGDGKCGWMTQRYSLVREAWEQASARVVNKSRKQDEPENTSPASNRSSLNSFSARRSPLKQVVVVDMSPVYRWRCWRRGKDNSDSCLRVRGNDDMWAEAHAVNDSKLLA